MPISINIKELYSIFEITPANQNIMLVGHHGIGKSKIIETYFTEKGMKVVPLFLGQMSDPGDLIGLPRLNEATGKTEFMPPYWFPTDGKPIVLFLDELNRARPEMLQSIMDLALNRKLAGKPLPEGSRIMSAVNAGEQYQVGDLDPALVSRFNIYSFHPSAKDWIDWAIKSGIDERIVSLIIQKPDLLDSSFDINADSLEKSADRRAWEKVSDLIKSITKLEQIHSKAIAGIIGTAATAQLMLSLQTGAVNGKQLLNSFPSLKSQISDMTLDAITILNDDVIDTINQLGSAKFKLGMADNLYKYLHWLLDTKRREAYSYFVNEFMKGDNKKAMTAVSKHKPELIMEFSKFIASI